MNFRSLAILQSAILIFLAGCGIHVDEHDKANGNKDVTISSPLGGLKVRTNNVDARDTGLSVYPGATLKEKDNKDHDQNKADVNIDTPWFGLKVVALTYESNDPQDKIWDYYKKEMSKYGRVLECRPGSPDLKFESKEKDVLTCDHNKHGGKNIQIDHGDTELKVGYDDRQRVVGFKPHDKGTEFSLVYVVTRGDTKGSE